MLESSKPGTPSKSVGGEVTARRVMHDVSVMTGFTFDPEGYWGRFNRVVLTP